MARHSDPSTANAPVCSNVLQIKEEGHKRQREDPGRLTSMAFAQIKAKSGTEKRPRPIARWTWREAMRQLNAFLLSA